MANGLSASTGCNAGQMHYAGAMHVVSGKKTVALGLVVCQQRGQEKSEFTRKLFTNEYARQFMALIGDGANWMIQVQTI